MSSPHTPSAAGPLIGTYTHPDGSDVRSVASVLVPLEAAEANIAFIAANTLKGTAGWYPVALSPVMNTNNRWGFVPSAVGWVQADITDGGELWFYLPTPPLGQIVTIEAVVDGNAGPGGGNHAGKPATMPVLEAHLIDWEGAGGTSLLGTSTDSSIDASAYDSTHTISIALGTALALNKTKSLAVKFAGEAGANSLVDQLLLTSIRFEVEATP